MNNFELNRDELRAMVTVHKPTSFAQQLWGKQEILRDKGYFLTHANGFLTVGKDGDILFEHNRFIYR